MTAARCPGCGNTAQKNTRNEWVLAHADDCPSAGSWVTFTGSWTDFAEAAGIPFNALASRWEHPFPVAEGESLLVSGGYIVGWRAA